MPDDPVPKAVPAEVLSSTEVDEEQTDDDLLRFLLTERGNALAVRVLSFFEDYRKGTIDAAAKLRADELQIRRLTIEERNRAGQRTWVLQTAGLLLVVATVGMLSFHDRLTPAAGTILGAVAGYLFGQRRPTETS